MLPRELCWACGGRDPKHGLDSRCSAVDAVSDDYPEQPLVLLDTNAIRNLFRPRRLPMPWLAGLRDEVLARVNRRQLRVVATQPLLWELTGIIEDEEYGGLGRYEEAITFLAEAAHEWWLKHEYERKRLELRRRCLLRNVDAFQEFRPAELIAQCLDPQRIATYQRLHRQEKDRERRREAALRLEVVEELRRRVGDNWRDELRDSLTNHWLETVRKHTRLEMRRFAQRERISIRGAQWPLPERAPTFWYGEAFHMSKARHVFLDGRGDIASGRSVQRMPDLIDATHFKDAAYVHVLVTDDTNFTAVANGARTLLTVETLVEFGRRLGLPPPL